MRDISLKAGKEKALLVKLITPSDSPWEVEESLVELGRLVESAGGEVRGKVTQFRKRADPAYYIGKGKARDLKGAAEACNCDLVVVDDDLTPAQDKNLEKCVEKRVLDRSELILDIFALRARTRQARLQVELAQLQYLLPRLTRMWEHLSRIRGGIGLRGPGETQLEVDRRVIRERIGHLRKQLKVVKRRREQQRGRRSGVYNIAIVGYTNAGKSSLFNLLTGSDAAAGDRLFETLDARTRVIDLDSPRRVVITDTVGFIRKLPHHLVASFRATLEEVVEADMLLHVIDISSKGMSDQLEVVKDVLADLGVEEKRIIQVFNKMDLIENEDVIVCARSRDGSGVCTSARERSGIDDLRDAIEKEMRKDEVVMTFSFPVDDARSVARLYAVGRVMDRLAHDGRVTLTVRMEREERDRLLKEGREGLRVE